METISMPGLDECWALDSYDGPARAVVTRLKYGNDRRALSRLADGLAALPPAPPPDHAVVTWMPTTAARRRTRGFDQAELLARAVARRWQIPCRALLRRQAGPPQTGRSLDERRQGVMVVLARAGRSIDVPVVLVDDVVTSGATLRSGAAVLRSAGAPWVGAVALARTPRSQ